MPKIYRSMKKAEDGKPVVEPSAEGLGVRTVGHADVDLDDRGNVVLNGKGMSVAPAWRDLAPHLVSRRLLSKFPDARGHSHLHCFTMGEGPFIDGPISDDLTLIVDRPDHGAVAPRGLIPLDRFQEDLAKTRDAWIVYES